MAARHAIYYTPPRDGALWRFGTSWLRRDPETGAALRPPATVDDAAIADPARYGFHATLKPPFRLRAGQTAEGLAASLERFARGERAFSAPPLALRAIGRFLALVPSASHDTLHAFAGRVVGALDGFRAPPTGAEIARRRPDRLSPRQREMLSRWGYPYVFEEFRFHLTLTGSLENAERELVAAVLAPLVAPLCREPLPIAEVALFEEPEPGAPFVLRRRFPLGG